MRDAGAPIPVTVVGGYLGAGKTTLVNHLLRHNDGRRIAVAVNEFGAIPIDSDLILGADGDVLTLAGGCICCTFGSDLVEGLIELARRDDIDHILIEASGVALPAAIAQSISLVAGLALDAIVVVVDAETVEAMASDPYMGDTVTRQLADADLVIVNKTDLIAEGGLAVVEQWLSSRAPRAKFMASSYSAVDIDLVLGIATMSVVDATSAAPRHVLAGYANASFTIEGAVDAVALAAALADDRLALVRAKGFVRDTRHGWTTLQVVGRRWSLAPAPAGIAAQGRLVCIAHGRRLDHLAIERLIERQCS